MNDMSIIHATQGNLNDISLTIPRNKLVVITGVSGSGKSTLAIDVIYKECQRQYLEAMAFQGIHKPNVESVQYASPAICISQNTYNRNPRSSLGTVTNIYTDLRMIYEKLATITCPHCHQMIDVSKCKEEVVKKGNDFTVYMHCSLCHHKMEKLTRSHFSYNTKEGACLDCQGLGKKLDIQLDKIVNQELSLQQGAVVFWNQGYMDYLIPSLLAACLYFDVPITKKTKVSEFSMVQKEILFYGVNSPKIREWFPDMKVPKTVAGGKFEGLCPSLWRKVAAKKEVPEALTKYFTFVDCPTCHGERLQKESREALVLQTRLPKLVNITLEELYQWIIHLEQSLDAIQKQLVYVYLLDIKSKIHRIVKVGLGYLSLDRKTMTLSGGEAQRIKLAATLDSTMTGLLYIIDEPTAGLHSKDTIGVIDILKDLCQLQNTVIVVEHDEDVIKQADYIIDIGPGSGQYGGTIVSKGSIDDIVQCKESLTGQYIHHHTAIKKEARVSTTLPITIAHASLYNLQDVSVTIPSGCLTTVTGVSGSGKSTLVFGILARQDEMHSKISGLEQFDQIITIEQVSITRMKRSNVATYIGLYQEIRTIFGNIEGVKENGYSSKDFSFNVRGGRCENCEGLGYITNNLLFFEDVETVCPVCQGKQFIDAVLAFTYLGYSIHDILTKTIEEAIIIFSEHKKIQKILQLLKAVGLTYLSLGQALTTLSGGEGQRLKLARDLLQNKGKKTLYLIDEPTTGLHPADVEKFIILLNKMVDDDNTVIVVEHNLQIIRASDWIIDLGPEGGTRGGQVVAVGTPLFIRENVKSITGQHL